MKRLITQPSELNEATQQSAPIDQEGTTVEQLAERWRRRKGHEARLASVTFTAEDEEMLLGEGRTEALREASDAKNMSETSDAAELKPTKADIKEQVTRTEARLRAQAAQQGISKPLGERALHAVSRVVKNVRGEVDAVRHRGMQLVETEHHGKVWVKVRPSATYTPRHTHIIHR